MKNLILTLVLILTSFQIFAQCSLTVTSGQLTNLNNITGEFQLDLCYSWQNAEPGFGNGGANIYFNLIDENGVKENFLILDNNVPYGSSGSNCGSISVTGSPGNYTFTSPIAPYILDEFNSTIGGGYETGLSFNLDFNGTCITPNFVYSQGPIQSCTDGIQNGDETGVDCGGSSCEPCNCDIPITVPSITSGVTLGNGNDCDLRGSDDLVYSFTVPTNGDWIISTCNMADFNTYLFLGLFCCSNGVTESDAGSGCSNNTSYLEYYLYANTTYYLTVEGANNTEQGSFSLEIMPLANCTDGIQNGDETGIDCGGSSCQPCICDENQLFVSLTFDDFASETTWKVTTLDDVTVVTGINSYTDGQVESVEEKCLEDGCYKFVIEDAYEDGMCCDYGNGSYLVTDADGNPLASGNGFFTSEEVTTFCFDNTPACGIPTGLEETDLTFYSVTLNWDSQTGATSYQLAGRKVGGNVKVFPPTNLTYRSFSSGLQSSTDYQWSVKALCDGVWTDYAPVQQFRTPIAPSKNMSSFDIFDDVENTLTSSIYPNPAVNELNIQFMGSTQNQLQVNILDLTGRVVMTQNVQNDGWETQIALDIADLQNGYYLVEVNDGITSTTSKLNVIK
ncbi:MAG: T9SS type A sorting domain-containing protein [Chitinophagales bacterium]